MGEVIDLDQYRRKIARRKKRRDDREDCDRGRGRGEDRNRKDGATSEDRERESDDRGPEKTPKA